MALNKKLIHFKKREFFDRELANGNVLENSICFIQDETMIYTHGTFYDGSTFDPSNIEESIQNIIDNYAPLSSVYTKQEVYTKKEVDSKFFIGTQAQYDSFIESGNSLQAGALVIILDDEELESDTIALLGTAILGKMILGNY